MDLERQLKEAEMVGEITFICSLLKWDLESITQILWHY